MTRTTVDLEPGLLASIKHLAAERRESMSRTVNRLLREAVAREQHDSGRDAVFRWHTVPDGEPVRGFDPASRDYLDLLDEQP